MPEETAELMVRRMYHQREPEDAKHLLPFGFLASLLWDRYEKPWRLSV